MAVQSSVTFEGVTGENYEFHVYYIGQRFDARAAVYFIVNRMTDPAGRVNYHRIFVGETGDISQKLDEHPKIDCFKSEGANRICVLYEDDEALRKRTVENLKERYFPVCND